MNVIGAALASMVVLASLGCRREPEATEGGTLSMDVGGLDHVEVGLLAPDGRFLFLRSSEFACQGLALKDAVLTVDPSKATGFYWDADGVRREVVAFSEVGPYRVYAADNLETELVKAAYITVRFSNPEKRVFPVAGTCREKVS